MAPSDLEQDRTDSKNEAQFNAQDDAIQQVIAASTPEQREKLRELYPAQVAAYESTREHNPPLPSSNGQQRDGQVAQSEDLSHARQVVMPASADADDQPLLPPAVADSGGVLLPAETANALDALKLSLEYVQKIRQLIPQIEESRLGTPLLDGLLVEVDALGDEMEELIRPSPTERAIVTARGEFAVHWLRRFVAVMKGA